MSKRITVPEGKCAIILDEAYAGRLYYLCNDIRKKGAKAIKNNPTSAHQLAGEYLLAYIGRDTDA